MSDPTSIFDNKDGAPPQNQTPDSNGNASPNAELTDLLNGIKNERGEPKYKTLKDALVGLQHAQGYIPDLKKTLTDKDAEIERLRREAERVANLEEAVRNLTERNSDTGSQPKSLSEQEIADLVSRSLEQTLTQKEIRDKQKANLNTVVESLKSVHGDSAEAKYNEKAKELGMSIEEFNALAAKSPKIVLTALGVEANKIVQSTAFQRSSVNSDGLKPTPETFIGRNKVPTLVGATTQDLQQEAQRANKMVEELHAAGRSVHDLTDPKQYFKMFGST